MTQLQVVDDIRNPTWLALNPAQTRLYAVSEIDNYQGTRSGAVVSYAIDAESLQLSAIGAVSSGGTAPAYVSVHPSGKFVFVANYGGGNVAVFPVGADGALGEATDVRPSVGPRHHARARGRSAGTIRGQRPRRSRTCTWSRRIRAGNSSSPTMRGWI